LQTDTPQRQALADTIRSSGFSGSGELESAVAAARRELSRLQKDYLYLGLRASLLAVERDAALRNLRKTQDYLAAVEPGFKASRPRHVQGRGETPSATAAPLSGEPEVTVQKGPAAATTRQPRWLAVVDAITRHTLPSKRLLLQLSDLRGELRALQADYSRLEQCVEVLTGERDAAREQLRGAVSLVGAMEARSGAPEPAAEPEPEAVDAVEQLESAQARLKHVQIEKNDVEIRLAEKDAVLAQLRAEREQAVLEIDQLGEQLSAVEQKLLATRDTNETLVSRLAGLTEEFDTVKSRDAQQQAMLEQQVARIEAALESARREREGLETSLEAEKARYAEVERQCLRLTDELEEQRGRLAGSESQLEDLRMQKEQYRSRLAELDQQRETVEQARQALADNNRSLREQLDEERARRDESEQQIDGLQLRHEQLLEQTKALGESLAATERLKSADDKLKRVQVEKNDIEIRLAEKDAALAELQAEREQALPEIARLNERLSTAEEKLLSTQEANETLRAGLASLADAFDEVKSRGAELDRQLDTVEQARNQLAEKNNSLFAELEAEKAQRGASEQQLAGMRQRYERLHERTQSLSESLSAAEQEQLALGSENQSLVSRLETMDAEFEGAKTRDRERIEWLEQRFTELEAVLERAHADREALELSLQEARAAGAELEREQQRLRDELRQKHETLGKREQQLAALQSQKGQVQSEYEALSQKLDSVQEAQLAADGENRKLEANLLAVVEEYGSTRKQDRQRIAGLEQQKTELELRLAGANRQIETLGQTLSETSQRLEAADEYIGSLEPLHAGGAAAATAKEPAPEQVVVGHRPRYGWSKAAAGFVFLLGVLATATKIWDVSRNDEEAPAQDELAQPGETAPVAEPIAALERAAGPARPAAPAPSPRPLPPQRETPAETAVPDWLNRMQSEGAGDRHVPEWDTASDKAKAAYKRRKAAAPLVEAFLMQKHKPGEAKGAPCPGATPCPQTGEKLSGEAIIGLPGGVRYSVIRNGTGRSPKPGDAVLVSYRATLPDGTGFGDLSSNDGVEAFRLSDAIPGLQDALQYMEEGAKWEVYVPAALAYRMPGPFAGREVIFLIELKSVTSPGAARAGR